jgi:ribosomal protein S18 acetylase RimI-like enzyme
VLYITEAKPEDLDSLQDICRYSFEFSMYRVDRKLLNLIGTDDLSLVSRNIISSSTDTLIAVNKGKILGFLSWNYEKSLSSITHRQIYKINLIAVSKDYRGQGIGSELLKYFINSSLKRGAQIVTVSTDENNIGAINFYSKHNFQYSSNFLTLRLFKSNYNSDLPKHREEINISVAKSKEEIHQFIYQNDEYTNYPFPILFEREIEEKIKSNVLDNYLRSLELNFDMFNILMANIDKKPVGYIVVKDDVNLSLVLSKISSKMIKVYRIFDIFVMKDFRGKGIGKYLIYSAINTIKDFDFVEIQIPSHNYPLINVLVSNNFCISHSMVNLFRR